MHPPPRRNRFVFLLIWKIWDVVAFNLLALWHSPCAPRGARTTVTTPWGGNGLWLKTLRKHIRRFSWCLPPFLGHVIHPRGVSGVGLQTDVCPPRQQSRTENFFIPKFYKGKGCRSQVRLPLDPLAVLLRRFEWKRHPGGGRRSLCDSQAFPHKHTETHKQDVYRVTFRNIDLTQTTRSTVIDQFYLQSSPPVLITYLSSWENRILVTWAEWPR